MHFKYHFQCWKFDFFNKNIKYTEILHEHKCTQKPLKNTASYIKNDFHTIYIWLKNNSYFVFTYVCIYVFFTL